MCLPFLLNFVSLPQGGPIDNGIDSSRSWSDIYTFFPSSAGLEVSAKCGVATSGLTNSFFMDGYASSRYVETKDFTSAGGNITFAMILGSYASGVSSCESIDDGEGVVFMYSTNRGSTWNAVAGWAGPDTYGTNTYNSMTLPKAASGWQQYAFDMPRSSTIRFKWLQISSSCQGCDNWAIDRISLPPSLSANITVTPKLLAGEMRFVVTNANTDKSDWVFGSYTTSACLLTRYSGSQLSVDAEYYDQDNAQISCYVPSSRAPSGSYDLSLIFFTNSTSGQWINSTSSLGTLTFYQTEFMMTDNTVAVNSSLSLSVRDPFMPEIPSLVACYLTKFTDSSKSYRLSGRFDTTPGGTVRLLCLVNEVPSGEYYVNVTMDGGNSFFSLVGYSRVTVKDPSILGSTQLEYGPFTNIVFKGQDLFTTGNFRVQALFRMSGRPDMPSFCELDTCEQTVTCPMPHLTNEPNPDNNGVAFRAAVSLDGGLGWLLSPETYMWHYPVITGFDPVGSVKLDRVVTVLGKDFSWGDKVLCSYQDTTRNIQLNASSLYTQDGTKSSASQIVCPAPLYPRHIEINSYFKIHLYWQPSSGPQPTAMNNTFSLQLIGAQSATCGNNICEDYDYLQSPETCETCPLDCGLCSVKCKEYGCCPAGTKGAKGGPSCDSCPAGTYTSDQGSTTCKSAEINTYIPNNRTTVPLSCGTGGVTLVTGATDPAQCINAVGYYRVSTSPPIFYECNPKDACLGGLQQSCSTEGPISDDCLSGCSTGYSGTFCGDCADGYYRLSGYCNVCPQNQGIVATLFVCVFAGGIIVLKKLNKLKESLGHVTIGINGIQIASLFPSFKIPWPSFFVDWFSSLSFFNLNLELTNPECSSPLMKDYYSKWLIWMLVPLIALVVFALAIVFAYLRNVFAHAFGHKLQRKYPHIWMSPSDYEAHLMTLNNPQYPVVSGGGGINALKSRMGAPQISVGSDLSVQDVASPSKQPINKAAFINSLLENETAAEISEALGGVNQLKKELQGLDVSSVGLDILLSKQVNIQGAQTTYQKLQEQAMKLAMGNKALEGNKAAFITSKVATILGKIVQIITRKKNVVDTLDLSKNYQMEALVNMGLIAPAKEKTDDETATSPFGSSSGVPPQPASASASGPTIMNPTLVFVQPAKPHLTPQDQTIVVVSNANANAAPASDSQPSPTDDTPESDKDDKKKKQGLLNRICVALITKKSPTEMQLQVFQYLGMLFLFSTLAYTFLATNALEPMDCTMQKDGKRTLDARTSIVCFEGRHKQWVPVFVCFIVLYVFGIPILLLSVLRYVNKRKKEIAIRLNHKVAAASAQTDGGNGKREDAMFMEKSDLMIGFMTVRYESNKYWWDVTILVRKLLIIIVQKFFSNTALFSIAAGLGVLFVSLMAHVMNEPFMSQEEDYLEALLTLTNFITLFSGLMYLTEKFPDEASKNSLSYLVVALQIVVLSGVVVLTILNVYRKTIVKKQIGIDEDTYKEQLFMRSQEFFEPEVWWKLKLYIKYASETEVGYFTKALDALHKAASDELGGNKYAHIFNERGKQRIFKHAMLEDDEGIMLIRRVYDKVQQQMPKTSDEQFQELKRQRDFKYQQAMGMALAVYSNDVKPWKKMLFDRAQKLWEPEFWPLIGRFLGNANTKHFVDFDKMLDILEASDSFRKEYARQFLDPEQDDEIKHAQKIGSLAERYMNERGKMAALLGSLDYGESDLFKKMIGELALATFTPAKEKLVDQIKHRMSFDSIDNSDLDLTPRPPPPPPPVHPFGVIDEINAAAEQQHARDSSRVSAREPSSTRVSARESNI